MAAPHPESIPLRWLKGLWWEPEQYLDWPPLLTEAGYNGLMLCYTFCPETSLHWRRPFRPAETAVIRRLAAECAAPGGYPGLRLCLALNPCIGGQAWRPEQAALPFHRTSGRAWFQRYWTARRKDASDALTPDSPLSYGSEADLALLVEKCRQALDLGVDAIALCLDDIEPETAPAGFPSLAAAQAHLVAALYAALELRPAAAVGSPGGGFGSSPTPSAEHGPRLLLAPTYYWTAGMRAHPEYIPELMAGLPPDVAVFWTGEHVRSQGTSGEAAREAADRLNRRPVLWYNYASNDSFRFALQLPPGPPPQPDLADEVAGVLVNPMRQSRLTRLHALVMGAWLRDPPGFDPAAALDAAVRRLVGDHAAPLLHAYLDAWAAYPDPRTLPADLAAGGAPALSRLASRVSAAADRIEALLPPLVAAIDDPALTAELAAGARRLRYLADALTLLQAEAERGQGALAPERARLLARLGDADPESACDAQALLIEDI